MEGEEGIPTVTTVRAITASGHWSLPKPCFLSCWIRPRRSTVWGGPAWNRATPADHAKKGVRPHNAQSFAFRPSLAPPAHRRRWITTRPVGNCSSLWWCGASVANRGTRRGADSSPRAHLGTGRRSANGSFDDGTRCCADNRACCRADDRAGRSGGSEEDSGCHDSLRRPYLHGAGDHPVHQRLAG